MADSILDTVISPEYPVGYTFWISNGNRHTLESEIIEWYRAVYDREPADSDIAHGLWRCINECDRWKTPRVALQNTWPKPVTPPVVAPIGTLAINGQFFTMDGTRFTIIECSDFSLFKRYLNGEDITPLLTERHALGFNTLRVWLLNTSVVAGGIHPNQYPDFYERLSAFIDLLASWGFVAELTVFTDAYVNMPDQIERQNHLDRTAAVARTKRNVLLELANEIDVNGDETIGTLSRPSGVIISRGSNGSDEIPPHHDAPWSYETYHTNGLNEWQRKVGHNAFEYASESGVPCIANENNRYPDRDDSVIHAEDAAEGGALLCAGSCFHSVSGKFSTLFDAKEAAGAAAYVAGAKSVPLEYQAGSYRHRIDLETPGVIRVYSRVLPDGREHVVYIRA